ncbi:YhcH/YjgK/YiaL family protein [Lachnospiraceae bacterium LCP25S3_G4]
MIFGNVKDWNVYEFLPENLRLCFQYIKEHDLINFDKGTYQIDGDKLYVNIVDYKTTTRDQRFWEAHRKYLDVHVMLEGEEKIDLNFIDNMEQQAFVKRDDFLPLEGVCNSHVVLKENDFLICYPTDGHMTAIQVDEPKRIKKAIFKVLI